MSIPKNYRNKPLTVTKYESEDKLITEVSLAEANQVLTIPFRPYSGSVAFEVSNIDNDLSGSATVNLQLSVSGQNWVQAVDINGDNITYSLTAGNTIADTVSGIPEGTYLRLIVVENLTGTLDVAVLK